MDRNNRRSVFRQRHTYIHTSTSAVTVTVVTSAREVMFTPLYVCLSAG